MTWRVVLPALLLALAGPVPAQAPPRDASGLTLIEPGLIDSTALFETPLVDLDNRPAPFAAWRGRPLIVNFWARWCGPCRVEIPELVALQQRRTGVEVIGLNIENDPAPVRDFARAYEVNYPVLLTREAGIPLMRALGNSKAGLPFTVVLDRRGAVVASRLGMLTREQLDAAIPRALR